MNPSKKKIDIIEELTIRLKLIWRLIKDSPRAIWTKNHPICCRFLFTNARLDFRTIG